MTEERSYVVRATLEGVPLVLSFYGSYENVFCGAKELYPGIKIQSITHSLTQSDARQTKGQLDK